MTTKKMLTKEQQDLLAMYYIHRLGIEHFAPKKERKYRSQDWSDDLRRAEIPMTTQGAVERLAADKAQFATYFSTLLSLRGLLHISE